MIDLRENFKIMRNAVYKSTADRKNRTNTFSWAMKLFKYFYAIQEFKFSDGNARGDFLEAYYVFMRCVDDIIDGDAKLPTRYKSTVCFIDHKINFAATPENPEDSLDYLLLYANELSKKFDQDFSAETNNILHSLRFDAKRAGEDEIFMESELNNHFYLLDIKGTIRAALKIFGEEPEKHTILGQLGTASRIYYNLRDYAEDVKAGFFNISAEDCERFGIKKDNISLSSPAVKNWFLYQTEMGVKLLEEYKLLKAEPQFKWLTNVTLNLAFEMPATHYFKKVLTAISCTKTRCDPSGMGQEFLNQLF